MANTFKTFLADDVTNTRTLLHENIPITGTLVSSSVYEDRNIKNFTHKRFQSVYDYPYLSSSANHIFDITLGISADSAVSGTTSGHTDIDKKSQMYNTMAQMLAGYDTYSSVGCPCPDALRRAAVAGGGSRWPASPLAPGIRGSRG